MEAVRHGLHVLELTFYQLHELVMVEIPRSRDNNISGRESVSIRIQHSIAFEPLHRLLGSQDRLSQRVVLPEILGENLMDEIIRIILIHLDLFHDHATFAGDVRSIKYGVEHKIAQDVEGRRNVLVEDLNVEADTLLGGKSVHVSANRVDLARNLFGRAVLGPFEYHVLNEMGNPVPLRIFVARTGLQPDADRRRSDMLHLLRNNGEPVGEFLTAYIADFLGHENASARRRPEPQGWTHCQKNT